MRSVHHIRCWVWGFHKNRYEDHNGFLAITAFFSMKRERKCQWKKIKKNIGFDLLNYRLIEVESETPMSIDKRNDITERISNSRNRRIAPTRLASTTCFCIPNTPSNHQFLDSDLFLALPILHISKEAKKLFCKLIWKMGIRKAKGCLQ